jgi:hypothetical protein
MIRCVRTHPWARVASVEGAYLQAWFDSRPGVRAYLLALAAATLEAP